MSRLATVVGALSAIVTLVDYLAAKSFMSHWLQRQIQQGADGWRISPTLNLLLIAGLVGAVWLLTEAPAGDPAARKRLFRLRANLVVFGLSAWFFFGPAIGDLAPGDGSAAPASRGGPNGPLAAQPAGPPNGSAITVQGDPPQKLPPAASPQPLGHTSQFTWNRSRRPAPAVPAWKPGDGLRAMAQLLEDASTPPESPAGR